MAFPLAGLLQGPVATEGAKSPSAPPAGAAPPPPGPPPPPAPAPSSSSTDDSASRSALFAQINRGEGITSGRWEQPQASYCCAASPCAAVLNTPAWNLRLEAQNTVWAEDEGAASRWFLGTKRAHLR